jgi:hypothetical protein
MEEWRLELLTAKSKVILIKLRYETTATIAAVVMTQTDKVCGEVGTICEAVTTKEVINMPRFIKSVEACLK